MNKKFWIVLIAAFMMLLVACGGTAPAEEVVAEPETEVVESTDTEEVVEEAMEEEMVEEMAPSIAEIASGDENFSTLVTALDAAGLVETLAGEGEFTVFAPTNDAFAALPEGTVESLLEDPSGALTNVLLYHVVEGAVMAETVVGLDMATTLQGEDVAISVVDGNVFLNETVQVVTTDIVASNGVIHVIDGVILPPTMMAAGDEDMAMSIAEIAAGDANFTTLVAALTAAGLVDTLAGEGEFTVFAPTDDAFAALPEGTVESLLEDPRGALTDVLLYHVVEGAVMAETVVGLDMATTLQGEDVSISVVDGAVFLNDTVQVTTTDIVASNGVIHVIDGVILPPTMMASGEEDMAMSIAEIAAGDESFSTLVAALDAAGLVETLAGEGEFTVFAPTNDAFAALPEGTVESLLEDPSGALTDILLYHVVEGAVMAETVVGLDMATTLQGEDVSISVVDGAVFLNDSVQVTMTDIVASNGVIHVIDGVILPPTMMASGDEDMAMSIAEIAAGDESFSTLVAALDAAGLVETLAGEGDFTVFAPTDDAFAALPEGTVESLLEDPSGALTDILLYHVVDGSVMAETVVGLDSATTIQGTDVSISVVDGSVFLNDSVEVVMTDIVASNGIIHVISGVLIPES